MKLLVTTPSGLRFTLQAYPTGKFANLAGNAGIDVVEVHLTDWQHLWAKPEDLCDDYGTPFQESDLRDRLLAKQREMIAIQEEENL